MDRRTFLAGAAATAMLGARAQAGVPSLREIGLSRGIDVGSAVAESRNPKYLDILHTHCSLLTPEWQLKPKVLRATADAEYRFGPADEIVAMAAADGQKVHGHSLFWHRQPIAWADSGDFDEVCRLYGGFIRDVVGRYPQIVSWDVFNEVVDDRKPLRGHALLKRFGLDFVEFCFRTAHEAAPAARLAINDHNLACAGRWCGRKQQNMLRTLEVLLERGVPVHAIGIQGHLSSTWKPWPRQTAYFIRRVGELGLDVYLSELDVNDSQLALDAARRDRQIAGYYSDFLGTVLEQPAVKRIVFWGISDSDHWMLRSPYKGEKRRNGRPRPALFDENDDPKPAFEAVARALSEAPRR